MNNTHKILTRRCVLWAAVMLVAASTGYAQGDIDPNAALAISVKMTARRYADSIVLRWAPEKALAWRAGLNAGYAIERAPVDRKGKVGAFESVAARVMPWTPEQWLSAAEVVEGRMANGSAADTLQSQYMQVAQALAEPDGAEVRINGGSGDDDLKAMLESKNQFEMQYGMALLAAERSVPAAQGLGLRYVDRTAKPGQAYVYRVRFLGRAEPYTVRPGEFTVPAEVYTPVKRPDAVGAVGQDGTVILQWWALAEYSGYVVDRSSDNGATFVRLTRVPIVTLRAATTENDIESYVDTALVNGRRYTYRVIGMTAFGDEEVLGEVVGIPRDRTPPGMPTAHAEHLPPRVVHVTWDMPEPVAADLAGFHIGRDTADAGRFPRVTRALLAPGAREFFDTLRVAAGTTYYRVEAVDSGGNVSRSFSAYVTFVDSTPPGAPQWVKGTMDTNGIVRLVFRPNSEPDVMGYRVLRSNDPDHEFSAVMETFGAGDAARMRDTVIVDTVEVRTLTKYVYYRLVALDYHFNESELSDMLAVPRPDVIPPVPPVVTGVHSTDTSVVLEFVPSSSRDLKRHILYRRATGVERWDSVANVGRDDSMFVDMIGESHARYDYAMRAADSAGLQSELSNIVSAETYDTGIRPTVTDVRAEYDSARGEVRLRWNYPGLRENFRYLIYRGADGIPPTMIAVVKDRAASSFVDGAPEGATVEYAVKVIADSGAESRLSDRAAVHVQRVR